MKKFRGITILILAIALIFSFILYAGTQEKPKTDKATPGSIGVAVDKPKTDKAAETTMKMEHKDHGCCGMYCQKMQDEKCCSKHEAGKAENQDKCKSIV